MNTILYLSTVLIWGSTWLAITFQLGEAPLLISVFYRFALASLLLLPVLWFIKKLQPTTRKDHFFLVLQGLCLFSFNFICFYNATSYIASGLVSIVFSLATLYNVLNNRLFYKEAIPRKILFAAIIGVSGLMIIFWPEFDESYSHCI